MQVCNAGMAYYCNCCSPLCFILSSESGTIEYDEFVKIFSAKLSIDPEQELKEVFNIFDKNGDGFISPEELYEMLQKLGENITQVRHR